MPHAKATAVLMYLLSQRTALVQSCLLTARLMGADPTTSPVTGECSTVELQPHDDNYRADPNIGRNTFSCNARDEKRLQVLPRQSLGKLAVRRSSVLFANKT